MTSAYAFSGVNIAAGNAAVALMSSAVRSTYGPEVLAGIGAFGGLFDASALQAMRSPVLVASTDGIGTKVALAARAGRFESLGHDIVNHCVNDILVQGARPLFFLDYVASSRLVPDQVAALVSGVAAACRALGCALLGGETAEMPGVYTDGAIDVAGAVVGVVERDAILPRPSVEPGDLLVGLASSGPHTNGYSLIRRVFAEVPLDTLYPELGLPLAEALLAPHRCYLSALWPHLPGQGGSVKALAHLTGGGFIENLPRVLPASLGAVVHLASWPVPPLFELIQSRGAISRAEMYHVFNMGIGMVVVLPPSALHDFQSRLAEPSWVIGEVVSGEHRVTLA
jgi:phosphoribosylformylglycinamidine cyclo-ligase/phosphoribosylamine--glycine ligase/phosphoribosylformylglycinamidine cyclo-ligase